MCYDGHVLIGTHAL